MLAIVRLVGARNAMPPAVRRRLELSGLNWARDLSPLMAQIRTVDDWAGVLDQASFASEMAGDLQRAGALAFLGQLLLSPFHPKKSLLWSRFEGCHVLMRSSDPAHRFEKRELVGGAVGAISESPTAADPAAPTVVLLPPLASTKEELGLLADPLLARGCTVIRMDLPGQGESKGPLTSTAELALCAALAELAPAGASSVFVGGVSLGGHFALRLAARLGRRACGVFAISPPAIVTRAHWASLPEVVYQYLDLYFDSPTREATYRSCLGLTLDDIPAMACPIRLFHARNDRIAQADAAQTYRKHFAAAHLTDCLYRDRHGCLGHLPEIARDVAEWVARLDAERRK